MQYYFGIDLLENLTRLHAYLGELNYQSNSGVQSGMKSVSQAYQMDRAQQTLDALYAESSRTTRAQDYVWLAETYRDLELKADAFANYLTAAEHFLDDGETVAAKEQLGAAAKLADHGRKKDRKRFGLLSKRLGVVEKGR